MIDFSRRNGRRLPSLSEGEGELEEQGIEIFFFKKYIVLLKKYPLTPIRRLVGGVGIFFNAVGQKLYFFLLIRKIFYETQTSIKIIYFQWKKNVLPKVKLSD